MLPVLGKSAIGMLVRREGWAWEGVSNLGALEAVEVAEGLQYGALFYIVHGLAFHESKAWYAYSIDYSSVEKA